jgi:hypothetical protein
VVLLPRPDNDIGKYFHSHDKVFRNRTKGTVTRDDDWKRSELLNLQANSKRSNYLSVFGKTDAEKNQL